MLLRGSYTVAMAWRLVLAAWVEVVVLASGCAGPISEAVPAADAPPATGPPRLGAHALAYHRLGGSVAPISTPAMNTMLSGSTIVVTAGRGDKALFSLPRDNKSNSPYRQLDTVHPYTNYPNSGTAIYAFPSAQGGDGHIVTADTTASDEITLAAVEVVNGRTIHDFKWNEVLAPNTLTSLTVTTTGPATLIAIWWGDAPEPQDKTAVPNNGFTVIDSILLSGALVQGAVATRDVSAAGSYEVTWTATPLQGAQLWLIAVQ